MSGDDLLQPLETIVDGRLVQGCTEREKKENKEMSISNNVVVYAAGNKLIEKSPCICVNSYSKKSHFSHFNP